MNTHLFRPAAVAAALLFTLPAMMLAQTEVLRPTLDFTPGLSGQQVRVSWPAQLGVRYRLVETRNLALQQWTYQALVEAEGPTAVWLDPEPPASRDFYQVVLPVAEVYHVSPPVLPAHGGRIYIYGQLIPPGSSLMLEVEGGPPVFASLVQIGTGVWQASVVGGLVPGGAILSAAIVDGTGGTICPIAQTFEITTTGLASEGSPFLPHAAPVPDASSNPIPGVGIVVKRHPGSSSVRVSNSSLPGEVTLEQCDMMLPVPAGPRLAWIRTYRSKGHAGGGSGGAAGRGWTHCYNVRIEPIPVSAGVNASRVYLFGGEGRREVLTRQPNGTYRGDGMFREGHFNPDSSFTLTFADQGAWIFCPLVGAPWQGRLGSIVDRNGVGLTLTYSAAGRLASIASQFGQSLTMAYTTDGRVQSIADHTGRLVEYSYFAAGEPGGSPEDLKSVSCPKLPGQSPVAGDTAYTYTTKLADVELNHNLLTVHDGAGRLLDEFTYAGESNPLSLEYDTCVSSKGSSHGHVTVLKLGAPSGPYPPRSYVCIENDSLGRVRECVFDAQHRCLSVRQYTGFATPGVEVTSTDNRPTGKLRSTDPDFYETTYLYNGQHLCTRVTEPDGTQHRITYDGDLRPDCPVRERANPRLITLRAPNGQERTATCEYKPGYGNLECARAYKTSEDLAVRIIQDGNCEEGEFQDILIDMKDQSLKRVLGTLAGPPVATELKGSDGKKHVEVTAKWQAQNIKYTGGGGKAQGVMGSKAKAWMVNNFEVHPVFGLKTEWITSIGLPKITPKISKESHGKFRLPLLNAIGGGGSIWDGGEEGGGCTLSIKQGHYAVSNFHIEVDGASGGYLSSIKQGHYAVSNFHAEIDGGGGGGGTASVCGNPIGGISIKGGKNPGGMMTRVLTSHGQVFTCDYDTHGNCISSRTPIAGGGTDWTYNALGQCTSSTVLNGAGSAFQTTAVHDPTTRFCSSIIRDPAGLHLTVSFDRDTLGRVTRLVDPRGFDWLCDYNPLDDVVQSSTPAAGSPGTASRIATSYFYDAAGYLARCDVEHRDGTGALVAANPAYSAFYVYDGRAQLVRVAMEDRPVNAPALPPLLDPTALGLENFAVRDFTLDDAGQCVRTSTPAACRGQATDAVCDYIVDERGLLYRGISGGLGALTSVTTQTDYNTAGLPVRVTQISSAGGLPGSENPTATCTYDGFHRLASCTDPMGNVVTYQYAENGFVTSSFFGEPNDVPGSAGNVLLAQCISKKMMGQPKIGEATAVFNISQGAVSGGGDPGGGARFDWRLLEIDKFYLADMVVEDPVLTFRRYRPAFFDVFVADDVWTWRRFSQTDPPVNETTTIVRSPAGLAQSITCNGDTLLTCAYDSAGRQNHCYDGTCAVTDVLDEAGRVISSTRTDSATLAGVPSKSFSRTAAYDALGRRTSTSDASGSSASQTYDSLGRTLSTTDASGVATVCRWDSEDASGGVPRVYKLVLEADVDGDGTYEVLSRIDSRSGECRSVTNSNGYETTLTRDALCRVTRRDHPDGTFETFSFDSLGRLSQWRGQDECLRTATFDLNGRAESVAWTLAPGSTAVPVPPTTYQYDGLSRTVACDQGASHLAWSYDSVGNELSETQNAFTFTRMFNHRGRTGITYPNGARFSETRNAHGDLISCSALSAGGTPINPPVVTMAYLGHRELRSTQANGVVTDYTYRGDGDSAVQGTGPDFSFDACVRSVVTNSLGVVLADDTVNRDRNQRVVRSESAFTEGSSASRPLRRKMFTLDRLGRITRCITGYRAGSSGGPLTTESDVTYTLDLAGNRLSATGGLHPGPYTLGPTVPPGDRHMNQYTSWPGGPLTWDDNGCLTGMSDGTVQTTLVYDACARLVAVNNAATGAPIATYGYDGTGRRTRSTIASNDPLLPPVSTYLIHDGSMCLQELNDNGEAEMTFVTGGTGLRHCISTKNGTLYYPHGGGGSGTALGKFNYPILDPIPTRLELLPETDPVLELRAPPRPGIVLTGSNGLAVERVDSDDAGRPIFLTADGLVRPGATNTISGYRWINRLHTRGNTGWCPETGFFQGGGTVYSPQLGRDVSVSKEGLATATMEFMVEDFRYNVSHK